jgi:Tol biopolymer transport system component
LWTVDLGHQTETRLTSDPGTEIAGAWLPDESAVIFSAPRGGSPHLFRKDLATGVEEELLPAGPLQFAQDVSPDGRTVVFDGRTGRGDFDVVALPLSGARTPSTVLQSPFYEGQARFSPNGRFLAFVSSESGRNEVYVTSFPRAGSSTRVSTGGANSPKWGRDGREIFYLSANRELVAVPVRTAPALELGTPVTLFTLIGPAWNSFDVSADGKRFLAVVPEVVANEQPLTVVLDWTAEIVR